MAWRKHFLHINKQTIYLIKINILTVFSVSDSVLNMLFKFNNATSYLTIIKKEKKSASSGRPFVICYIFRSTNVKSDEIKQISLHLRKVLKIFIFFSWDFEKVLSVCHFIKWAICFIKIGGSNVIRLNKVYCVTLCSQNVFQVHYRTILLLSS